MSDEIDIVERLKATTKQLAGCPVTAIASYRTAEAAEVIQYQRRAMRAAAKIIEAQDRLLAAYRTRSRPSERTLDALEKRDDVLARLTGKLATGGK